MAAIMVGNSFLPGCSSNNGTSPAPITVTKQATPCTGNFGYAYFGSANAAFFNYILASGVSIASASPVTAYNLGIYMLSTSVAGLIRGAIYAGTTTGPTTLIAQSAPQSIAFNTWNEIPVPSTPLSPGSYYWLAFQAENSTAYCETDYFNSTSGYSFITNNTFSFGLFPSAMPAGITSNFPSNYYVNTCP